MPDTLIVPPFRTSLLSSDGRPLSDVPGANGAGGPPDGRIRIETTKEWWLYWRTLAEIANAGALMITFGLHDDRPQADGMPNGAIYVESDRGVIYQNQGGEWHYLAGTMYGTLSPDERPTNLGPNDAGFEFRSTDASAAFAPRYFTWSGTIWVDATLINYGTHASRPPADALTPPRSIYVETDRSGVIYQQQGNTWHFLAGTMWGTLSPDQRPTDLGVNDAGFHFRSTDPPPREYIWSGTAWVDASTVVGAVSGAANLTHPNVVTKVSSTAGAIVEGGITDDSAANSDRMRITAAGTIAIGNDGSVLPHTATSTHLIVGKTSSTDRADITVANAQPASVGAIGGMSFANYSLAAADKRVGAVLCNTDGTADSAALIFNTMNVGTRAERMRITAAGNIGIGSSTVPIGISAFAGRTQVTVKGSTEGSLLELATASTDGDNTFCALMSFVDSLNSQADKRIAQIHAFRSGTTALNRGGFLAFSTRADSSSAPSERMRITAAGNVGIGATNPLSRLAVIGLPTSSAGLNSGDIWRDAAAGNVLKIVP